MANVGALKTTISLDSAQFQQSMSSVNRQLKSLQHEQKAVTSSGTGFARGLTEMRSKADVLSRTFDLQKGKVEELRRRYDESKRATGENSKETENAQTAYNRAVAEMNRTEEQLKNLTAEIQRQENPWNQLSEKMTSTGDKLQNVGKKATDFGKTWSMRVTAPIVGMSALMLKTGMDFEQSMSNVQAVSGATGDDLIALETAAREMGAQTSKSASEAADGLYYMALAGWDTEQMLGGLEPILRLSEAGAIDLGRASDLVTDSMSAMQIEVKDLPAYLDNVAEASRRSNTDIDALMEAYVVAGGNLAAFNVPLEESTAILGLLANRGLKGSEAGRALNAVMVNLTSGAGRAGEAMDELGISAFDSEGNFIGLEETLRLVKDRTKDMTDEQKAQYISMLAGKEHLKSFQGLLAGLDDEYGDLKDSVSDADGALMDMATTMQDNAQGNVTRLKSAFEELSIQFAEHLLPMFTAGVEKAQDLIEWFSQLDEDTKKNIITMAGLAAAIGPAAVIFGNLTSAVGGFLKIGGGLAGMIGKAGGAGMAGRIAMLGPAGVTGLAIAGIGLLSLKVIDLIKESNKLEQASTDVAESISDQAGELKSSVDTFDELSAKANITNEQLAELHEINEKIANSNSPGEIKALQEQYDALAEKSGLSKDELNELFTANDNIIAQAPDVQAAVSDTGTKFVENTDAVNEYVASLQEMSRVVLESEREKNLANEKTIIEEITNLEKDRTEAQLELQQFLDLQKMSKEDLLDKEAELSERYYDAKTSEEEKAEILKEQQSISDAIKVIEDEKGEALQKEIEKRQESLEEIEKSLGTEEEKLEKIRAFDEEYANVLLKQVGINEEGEKGLAQLDEVISKNQEELAALDEKLATNGSLSQEEQNRHDKLQENIAAQQDIKNHLYNELGLYTDINSLIDGKLAATDEETRKKVESLAATRDINVEEGNILEQLQSKNSELVEERSNLIENLKQQGATTEEINDQVSGIDDKIIKNDGVIRAVLEELGLWEDVKNQINLGSDAITGQGYGIDDNNTKTKIGIGLEEDRTAEAASSVEKDVRANDRGTVRAIDLAAASGVVKHVEGNDFGSLDRLQVRAELRAGKRVDVDDYGSIASLNRRASSPVTKTISVVAKGVAGLLGYATGTPAGGHKGGSFFAGEEGWELGRMGSRWEMLNFGLYDRPMGYEVFTHDESKKIVKALNNTHVPGYATGARSPGEADRLVSNLNDLPNQFNNPLKPVEIILQVGSTRIARAIIEDVNRLQGQQVINNTVFN